MGGGREVTVGKRSEIITIIIIIIMIEELEKAEMIILDKLVG